MSVTIWVYGCSCLEQGNLLLFLSRSCRLLEYPSSLSVYMRVTLLNIDMSFSEVIRG